MSKALTTEELQFCWNNGYVIHRDWISPDEGYEYTVHKTGSISVLIWRKSARACYNAIKRWVEGTEPEPDEHIVGSSGSI